MNSEAVEVLCELGDLLHGGLKPQECGIARMDQETWHRAQSFLANLQLRLVLDKELDRELGRLCTAAVYICRSFDPHFAENAIRLDIVDSTSGGEEC